MDPRPTLLLYTHTVLRFQEGMTKIWLRYQEKADIKLNLGQELHGNRFGDFEKCCAIGIYSIEMWVDFINVRSEA